MAGYHQGFLIAPHQNQDVLIWPIATFGNIVRFKQLINCHGTSPILGTDYPGSI